MKAIIVITLLGISITYLCTSFVMLSFTWYNEVESADRFEFLLWAFVLTGMGIVLYFNGKE